MRELDALELYLKKNGYNYQRIDEPCPPEMQEAKEKYAMPDGWLERHQIIVCDSNGTRLWDAICQWGSYGYSQGLLEIMGSLVKSLRKNEVEGWLTAQDIIDRLENKA